MSWAFITALKQNPQQSYVQLLNSIRDVLDTKYTQKPQLSCSHPLGKMAQKYMFPSITNWCRYKPPLRNVTSIWESGFCNAMAFVYVEHDLMRQRKNECLAFELAKIKIK